jgi:hypothetical protein
MTICTSSSIRTLTVGSGLSPDLLTPLWILDFLKTARCGRSRAHRLTLSRCRHTAGGEFRPALKTH